MSDWFFNPEYVGSEAEQAFCSLDAVFAADGELITSDQQSRVLRMQVGDRRYYVKRYQDAGQGLLRRWLGLRDLFGPQRVCKEWENLQAFAAWNIPTAILVAYGQERRVGRFVRGALITEEIPHTMDLAKMALQGDGRLKNRRWVAQVSGQIAVYARTMHQAGFAHNDLKWRNILVDAGDTPRVYLIDCPAGSYWWQPFLDYRIIKDLACLDKVAKYQLSRTQRLRFYLDYAQHSRLTAVDKRKVRKIVGFFAGRE